MMMPPLQDCPRSEDVGSGSGFLPAEPEQETASPSSLCAGRN